MFYQRKLLKTLVFPLPLRIKSAAEVSLKVFRKLTSYFQDYFNL